MKIIKILGAVIGAIVVIAVLFLSLTDFSKYKPDIEAAVTEATGREFRINGDLQIKPLPSPFVQMEGVTLANAPWAAGTSMVEVGHVSARVGLWSLLFKPIVVHDFQLRDVTVLVETSENDESNLDFDNAAEESPADEEAASGSVESPVFVRNAEISNINVVFKKPDSDDMSVGLESLTVVTNDAEQQEIDGAADFLGTPITFNGTVDDSLSDINATFGNIQYRSVTEYSSGEAVVDITLSSLSDIGDTMEISSLPAEDLTLTGDIALRGDNVVLTDLAIGVGTAKLIVNGDVDGATTAANLDLVIDVPSMTVLSPDLPDLALTGSATLKHTDTLISLDPFELAFGESDLSGSFSVDGLEVPEITLTAQSSLLDMGPFTAEEEAEPAEDQTAPEEAAPAEADSGEDARYVFKEKPLNLEALRGFRADIDVTVDRMQGRTTYLEDFLFVATADDGVMKLDNSFVGGRGGSYENHVELDASGNSADLQLKALASDLRLGLFSGSEIPDDQVPVSDLNLDITASGGSPRQMASSVNGRVLFTQGPGRVKNDLIGRISGDLIGQIFGALNPFAKEEEFSNWECSIFALDFETGVGEITGFLLQGEKIMVVGGGDIDLNTEKIGIEFNTKPREGVGVSADMFVTPFVSVSGTLAEPGVGLNPKGVLLEGGLAVATGGLSFLYKGFMDRATANADQCEKTLAEIGVNESSGE